MKEFCLHCGGQLRNLHCTNELCRNFGKEVTPFSAGQKHSVPEATGMPVIQDQDAKRNVQDSAYFEFAIDWKVFGFGFALIGIGLMLKNQNIVLPATGLLVYSGVRLLYRSFYADGS